MQAGSLAFAAALMRRLPLIVVVTAAVVVFPLLLLALLVLTPMAVWGAPREPLAALGLVLWVSGGLAGLFGLVTSRFLRGDTPVARVRRTQLMLAAGVASAVAAAGVVAAAVWSGSKAVVAVYCVAFLVLIVAALAEARRVNRLIAYRSNAGTRGVGAVAALFLGMTLLTGLAALLGTIMLWTGFCC